MKSWRLMSLLGGLFLFVTLACAVPTVPDIGGIVGPAPTPTPLGNTLEFWSPTYTIGLAPGESVPGAKLEYVSLQEPRVYAVRIDGQDVIKRNADSFFWQGVVAPGVIGDYELRIGAEVLGELQVAGSIRHSILNPVPVELTTLPVDSTFWNFRNFVVDYRIPVGSAISGTPIVFAGTQLQGDNMLALLSGSANYSQLAFGDSLVYSGQLLDNVFLRYSLRTSSIDEDGLRLTGTAELWLK